ncbi:formate dehydrogenase subunit delta [Kribbella sp. NPDC059898]|uniref:formate dehydrogenase subunit delta n=1 Tax=Kribbella sp. NPDC059898 TaxID=3346995 RepID=UPI0036584CDA
MSTPPALRLAGDIAAQFQHLPADEAAERVAHHITLFWDPRMLAQLRALAGAGCDPIVARAVTLLGAS